MRLAKAELALYIYYMLMKLDMAKIKTSLKRENETLLKKGSALPYLADGEIKFMTADTLKDQSKLREPA